MLKTKGGTRRLLCGALGSYIILCAAVSYGSPQTIETNEVIERLPEAVVRFILGHGWQGVGKESASLDFNVAAQPNIRPGDSRKIAELFHCCRFRYQSSLARILFENTMIFDDPKLVEKALTDWWRMKPATERLFYVYNMGVDTLNGPFGRKLLDEWAQSQLTLPKGEALGRLLAVSEALHPSKEMELAEWILRSDLMNDRALLYVSRLWSRGATVSPQGLAAFESNLLQRFSGTSIDFDILVTAIDFVARTENAPIRQELARLLLFGRVPSDIRPFVESVADPNEFYSERDVAEIRANIRSRLLDPTIRLSRGERSDLVRELTTIEATASAAKDPKEKASKSEVTPPTVTEIRNLPRVPTYDLLRMAVTPALREAKLKSKSTADASDFVQGQNAAVRKYLGEALPYTSQPKAPEPPATKLSPFLAVAIARAHRQLANFHQDYPTEKVAEGIFLRLALREMAQLKADAAHDKARATFAILQPSNKTYRETVSSPLQEALKAAIQDVSEKGARTEEIEIAAPTPEEVRRFSNRSAEGDTQFPNLSDLAHKEEAKAQLSELETGEKILRLMKTFGESRSALQFERKTLRNLRKKFKGESAFAYFSADRRDRLLALPRTLRRHVVGQDTAIQAVYETIWAREVGLEPPERPTVLYFAGPTGVGKTEVAKSLAAALFGNKKALVRLDMSEFQESHTVSKLIGSPPGYIGHDAPVKFMEQVKEEPHSVILLDEFDKAHPAIAKLFLQVFEDGRLTNSKGETVDFGRATIILSSNTGSTEVAEELRSRSIGFVSPTTADRRSRVQSIQEGSVQKNLSPEFRNRIDQFVYFHPLEPDHIRAIATIQIRELNDWLKANKRVPIQIRLSDSAIEWLVQRGHDPELGARPLRRLIRNAIRLPLSRWLLSPEKGGQLRPGDVTIDARGDDLIFSMGNRTLGTYSSTLAKKTAMRPLPEARPSRSKELAAGAGRSAGAFLGGKVVGDIYSSAIELLFTRDLPALKAWRDFDDLRPIVAGYVHDSLREYAAISALGAAGDVAGKAIIGSRGGLLGKTRDLLPLWAAVIGTPILTGHGTPTLVDVGLSTGNILVARAISRSQAARPAVVATSRGLEYVGRMLRLSRSGIVTANRGAMATFNFPEAIALTAVEFTLIDSLSKIEAFVATRVTETALFQHAADSADRFIQAMSRDAPTAPFSTKREEVQTLAEDVITAFGAYDRRREIAVESKASSEIEEIRGPAAPSFGAKSWAQAQEEFDARSRSESELGAVRGARRDGRVRFAERISIPISLQSTRDDEFLSSLKGRLDQNDPAADKARDFLDSVFSAVASSWKRKGLL